MQPVVMAQPPAYQRMLRCGVFILGHMYDVAWYVEQIAQIEQIVDKLPSVNGSIEKHLHILGTHI